MKQLFIENSAKKEFVGDDISQTESDTETDHLNDTAQVCDSSSLYSLQCVQHFQVLVLLALVMHS